LEKTKKNAPFSLTFRKMIDKVCLDVYTTIRLYGGFIMQFKQINKNIPLLDRQLKSLLERGYFIGIREEEHLYANLR